MTTTEFKPSAHYIEATETEIGYLNDLSVANARYRGALRSLRDSCDRELRGNTIWGIPRETLNEVQKFEGALNQLNNMKWILFAGMTKLDKDAREAHHTSRSQWMKLAMEENPHGALGANQFFPKQ